MIHVFKASRSAGVAVHGDGQRLPKKSDLFTVVRPRQNGSLEWPHQYLIHRIFRTLVKFLTEPGIDDAIIKESILEKKEAGALTDKSKLVDERLRRPTLNKDHVELAIMGGSV